LVHKRYGDAFEGTDLEAVLAERSVGRLVVTGAQTDACIRSTMHGGFARGYDVTLVGDAHTTEDLSEWGAPPPEQVIAHTNLYLSFQRAPGRDGGDRGGAVRRERHGLSHASAATTSAWVVVPCCAGVRTAPRG
jgi:hypothetical protein